MDGMSIRPGIEIKRKVGLQPDTVGLNTSLILDALNAESLGARTSAPIGSSEMWTVTPEWNPNDVAAVRVIVGSKPL